MNNISRNNVKGFLCYILSLYIKQRGGLKRDVLGLFTQGTFRPYDAPEADASSFPPLGEFGAAACCLLLLLKSANSKFFLKTDSPF